MAERSITEHIELAPEERWAYYRRYYEAASAFYGARDRVVDEAEVERRVRGLKQVPAPVVRRRTTLSAWRFAVDEADEGLRREFWSRDHDESGWQPVRIPHSVNHVPREPVRYGSSRYAMLVSKDKRWDIWTGDYACWYKTRIAAERAGPHEVACLRFGGVNLVADVWVNGDPVMIDHLGLFPFDVEVTEELEAREGAEAVIAVRARGRATNTPYLFANGLQIAYGRPPFSNATIPLDTVDASWSGLCGEAALDVMDRSHLEDAFLFTEELTAASARLRCRIEIRNERWSRFEGSVRIDVGRWTPREEPPATVASATVAVRPMAEGAVEVRFDLEPVCPWSVETPSLYLAHVVLLDESGREVDDLFQSFGARTVRLQGTRVLINGAPVVLRGTHDLSNYHGESLVCPGDHAIVRDILLHQGMNANCSRWPSDIRMHHPRIAEYADQLGFMLSWTGYFEMWNMHPEAELYARRDVRAMVRSLRNHPSIIVWEMGDEPLMLIHPARRWRWYEQVTRLVEQEDRSRPIIPAGAWCNELVDLLDGHPKDLGPDERRAKVLADFPLFAHEGLLWDYHYCPYHPGTPNLPTYEVIGQVKRAFGRHRPAILTEFGVDGMPRFENVRQVYGEFRWKGSALMPVDRTKSDLRYYGRAVGQDDWKETQAAQAVTMAAIIGQLRESPDDFAGYYLVTLVDPWTFTWGVVDAAWNAKLAWFVVRGCYGPVHVSGAHGSAAVSAADGPLEVTASTYGGEVTGATLSIRLKDHNDRTVWRQEAAGISLPAHGRNARVAEIPLKGIAPGTYTVEYEVRSVEGTSLAHLMELVILRQ